MISRGTLEGLNALRFWAAASIIIYHSALLPALPQTSAFSSVITNFGGFGVPLFYAVSAFSLAYRYEGQLQGPEAIRTFYIRRFFRIAPLFYVMMIVWLLVYWFRGQSVAPSLVVSSATFTFNLLPGHSEGYVWASWSIGVEMLFYAVFPVLLISINGLSRAFTCFVAAAILAASWEFGFKDASQTVRTFANFSIMAFLHHFAAGLMAFFIWKNWTLSDVNKRLLVCTVIGAGIAFVANALAVQTMFGRVLGWDHSRAGMTTSMALLFAGLIIGMSFAKFRLIWLRWTAKLGEASFSLYLWHPLIIGIFVDTGMYSKIYAVVEDPRLAFIGCLGLNFLTIVSVSLASFAMIEQRMGGLAARAFEEVRVSRRSVKVTGDEIAGTTTSR
jgi:peptidoglycan/LPS O-acetylase OafA/YrhL